MERRADAQLSLRVAGARALYAAVRFVSSSCAAGAVRACGGGWCVVSWSRFEENKIGAAGAAAVAATLVHLPRLHDLLCVARQGARQGAFAFATTSLRALEPYEDPWVGVAPGCVLHGTAVRQLQFLFLVVENVRTSWCCGAGFGKTTSGMRARPR
jgi:hypothetical protein